MDEPKFTPGPWRVHKRKQYADGTWERIDVYAENTEVCGVSVLPEQEANAAVIAASPEMYKMLERILDCRTMGFGDMPTVNEIGMLLLKAQGNFENQSKNVRITVNNE